MALNSSLQTRRSLPRRRLRRSFTRQSLSRRRLRRSLKRNTHHDLLGLYLQRRRWTMAAAVVHRPLCVRCHFLQSRLCRWRQLILWRRRLSILVLLFNLPPPTPQLMHPKNCSSCASICIPLALAQRKWRVGQRASRTVAEWSSHLRIAPTSAPWQKLRGTWVHPSRPPRGPEQLSNDALRVT